MTQDTCNYKLHVFLEASLSFSCHFVLVSSTKSCLVLISGGKEPTHPHHQLFIIIELSLNLGWCIIIEMWWLGWVSLSWRYKTDKWNNNTAASLVLSLVAAETWLVSWEESRKSCFLPKQARKLLILDVASEDMRERQEAWTSILLISCLQKLATLNIRARRIAC